MLLVVFGFAVLVLAIGMLVLFAMFGELSTRVAEGGQHKRGVVIRPLERAHIGRVPEHWPPGLPPLSREVFTLIVLSSACSSCAEVAAQLTSDAGHSGWTDTAVVVSTAHLETGQNFIAGHGLGGFPHFVDVLGEWTRGEFDVQFSPSALVFRDGMLAEAYSFTDVAALRAAVNAHRARAARQEAAA